MIHFPGLSDRDYWTSGNQLGSHHWMWMATGQRFNTTFNYWVHDQAFTYVALLLRHTHTHWFKQRILMDFKWSWMLMDWIQTGKNRHSFFSCKTQLGKIRTYTHITFDHGREIFQSIVLIYIIANPENPYLPSPFPVHYGHHHCQPCLIRQSPIWWWNIHTLTLFLPTASQQLLVWV